MCFFWGNRPLKKSTCAMIIFNAGSFGVVYWRLDAEAAYFLSRKEYYKQTQELFSNCLESHGPSNFNDHQKIKALAPTESTQQTSLRTRHH